MKKGAFSVFSIKAVCILFFLFAALALWGGLSSHTVGTAMLLMILFFTAFCLAAAPRYRTAVKNAPALALLTISVIFSVLLRGAWLWAVKTEPISDFSRFYDTAASIASNSGIDIKPYIAVFPHTLGYSAVLSAVFRLFGTSLQSALLFNLFLSAGIAALLFFIGRLMASTECGFYASMIWAANPAQILYVSLVCTEYLFLFLLLLCVWLYLRITGRKRASMGYAALWCVLGACIAILNAIRPMWQILAIAFILHYLVFVPSPFSHGVSRLRLFKLLPCALLLACCVLANAAYFRTVGAAVGRPVSGGGSGWSLFVGMNADEGGRYSMADEEVFSKEKDAGMSASALQSYFEREAGKRFRENLANGKLGGLLWEKFTGIWSSDHEGIYWVSASQSKSAASVLTVSAHKKGLLWLADGFYFLTLILCAAGLYAGVRDLNPTPSLGAIVLFGFVLLFLAAEANPRYHFPADALIGLPAAYMLSRIGFRVPRTVFPRLRAAARKRV